MVYLLFCRKIKENNILMTLFTVPSVCNLLENLHKLLLIKIMVSEWFSIFKQSSRYTYFKSLYLAYRYRIVTNKENSILKIDLSSLVTYYLPMAEILQTFEVMEL